MSNEGTVINYTSECVGADGYAEFADEYTITRNGQAVLRVVVCRYERGGHYHDGEFRIEDQSDSPSHLRVFAKNWDESKERVYESVDDGRTWKHL